jgi:UDP-N-acetylglucosamine 2-epimerase
MRIATVIGNRPQFVKAAAVSQLLRGSHEELIIHTGQHHDDSLSRIFFEELRIPEPASWLGVASGTNTSQLQRMLSALERELLWRAPDLCLVYGDTNSTLAGALVAAQMQIPVAHVEAGMRSFDKTMPEELNRVLTDRASDLLFCSTETAVSNLQAEGIDEAIHLVGDVMADVLQAFLPIARRRSDILAALAIERGDYLLLTAHRSATVDNKQSLERLVSLIESLDAAVVFPLHPRTRARLVAWGLFDRLQRASGVRLCEPVGYLDFLRLLDGARAILTDSGGAQKEAYLVGTPCITLRETTEWIETVESGWNVLTGLDQEAVFQALERPVGNTERAAVYGDGHAGKRICEFVSAWGSS